MEADQNETAGPTTEQSDNVGDSTTSATEAADSSMFYLWLAIRIRNWAAISLREYYCAVGNLSGDFNFKLHF